MKYNFLWHARIRRKYARIPAHQMWPYLSPFSPSFESSTPCGWPIFSTIELFAVFVSFICNICSPWMGIYLCLWFTILLFGKGMYLCFFYCKTYKMFASGKAIAWMTFKATKEMRRNKDCAAGPIERRVLASTSVPRLIGFVQKMHQSISVHHLKYKIHSHKYKMHSHKYKIHCHKYKIRHTVS